MRSAREGKPHSCSHCRRAVPCFPSPLSEYHIAICLSPIQEESDTEGNVRKKCPLPATQSLATRELLGGTGGGDSCAAMPARSGRSLRPVHRAIASDAHDTPSRRPSPVFHPLRTGTHQPAQGVEGAGQMTCEGMDCGHAEEELRWMCGGCAAHGRQKRNIPESLTRHQRGAKWPADSASRPPPKHRPTDTK